MINIWIVGHWCSCNMGDKYQPYVILHAIKNSIPYIENKIKINLINFFGDDGNKMFFNIGDKIYDINDPYNQTDIADLCILTTGSMNSKSNYIKWIQYYLDKKMIKQLIIWGGFTVENYSFEYFAHNLKFITDNNVQYFARSYNDMLLYQQIYKYYRFEFDKDYRCRLAGDPMCWWGTISGINFTNSFKNDASYYSNFIQINDFNKPVVDNIIDGKFDMQKTLIIPSIYSIERNEDYWSVLINKYDFFVSNDNHSDYVLTEKYPNKIIFITEPWVFLDFIKGINHIISARLHGVVTALGSNTYLTMINTDNSPDHTGSFKYNAVGKTGMGYNKPICNVYNTHDMLLDTTSSDIYFDSLLNPKEMYNDNISGYINLTMESLDIIVNMVNTLSKDCICS